MKPFTIGRNENNHYVINDNTVSGNHAHIEVSNDFKTFVLKDLNSTNGTIVNGQTIISKIINKKQKIKFGSHPINTEIFFTRLDSYIIENRTDFTAEYQILQEVEKKYLNQKYRTNKFYKLKSVSVRGLITVGLMLAILQSKIFDSYEHARTLLMIGVGAVGGIISTASTSEKRLKNKMDDLYVEFVQKFSCPKCKFDLSSKSWKLWKSKKNCPKCNCKWSN